MNKPSADNQAQALLSQLFGFDQFRYHQADIIDTVVCGEDALVLMPTGGGKSLCYQLPALIRDGVGIVVSPLIALMQDQVSAISALGIRCAYLNSSLSFAAKAAVKQQLRQGELDLLYVAPERLLNPQTLSLLADIKVALFAIDEAHCVSQWGHDFRPEYQQLKILAKQFPDVPRIALTATADQRTKDEIVAQLSLHQARQFIHSFDRPNICYNLVEGGQSKQNLWQFIQQNHREDAGIVYCLSRKKVDAIAQWLNDQGRRALPYHAGLSNDVRAQNQSRFLREDGIIIVATIAFGMGIDKPDVRFVAHLNLPKSIEAYYQETGRAGRDGEPANAWMAYQLNDVITLRQMVQSGEGNEQFIRITLQKLDAMLGLCERIDCRRQALLGYFDEILDQPCGNCDNCLSPPVTWEGTQAAQKALSCAYRTGQRFGVMYLVEVLRGSDNERVMRNQHDQLAVYGIGKDLSVKAWRSIYRQLIARGHLLVDAQAYGSLRLAPKCRELLKGEQPINFRQITPDKKLKAAKKRPASTQEMDDKDLSLFDAMKELRMTLAKENNIPPFVVFHDTTLIQMVEMRPRTLQEMMQISGVGEKKLASYGEAFLALCDKV